MPVVAVVPSMPVGAVDVVTVVGALLDVGVGVVLGEPPSRTPPPLSAMCSISTAPISHFRFPGGGEPRLHPGDESEDVLVAEAYLGRGPVQIAT